MQSYLGDYPGARTNPEMKFIRAVYSMIGQSNPNWELIIAADGCKITERLYKEHFQHYSNIKFFMVEKPEDTTMNNKDRNLFITENKNNYLNIYSHSKRKFNTAY